MTVETPTLTTQSLKFEWSNRGARRSDGFYHGTISEDYSPFLCEKEMVRLGLIPKDTQSFVVHLRATRANGYTRCKPHKSYHESVVVGRAQRVRVTSQVRKLCAGLGYFKVTDIKTGRAEHQRFLTLLKDCVGRVITSFEGDTTEMTLNFNGGKLRLRSSSPIEVVPND